MSIFSWVAKKVLTHVDFDAIANSAAKVVVDDAATSLNKRVDILHGKLDAVIEGRLQVGEIQPVDKTKLIVQALDAAVEKRVAALNEIEGRLATLEAKHTLVDGGGKAKANAAEIQTLLDTVDSYYGGGKSKAGNLPTVTDPADSKKIADAIDAVFEKRIAETTARFQRDNKFHSAVEVTEANAVIAAVNAETVQVSDLSQISTPEEIDAIFDVLTPIQQRLTANASTTVTAQTIGESRE